MLIIRKFQPNDFNTVIGIEKLVFNEHDPFYYMKFYETCSEGFVVAEMDGIVAGFVVGYRISEETGYFHESTTNLSGGCWMLLTGIL